MVQSSLSVAMQVKVITINDLYHDFESWFGHFQVSRHEHLTGGCKQFKLCGLSITKPEVFWLDGVLRDVGLRPGINTLTKSSNYCCLNRQEYQWLTWPSDLCADCSQPLAWSWTVSPPPMCGPGSHAEAPRGTFGMGQTTFEDDDSCWLGQRFIYGRVQV